MLKKQITGLFCLAVLFALIAVPVNAAVHTPIEEFDYSIQQAEKTVLLSRYTGSASDVTVPGSYILDGTQYGVVLDSTSVFFENEKLCSVTLEQGVAFSGKSMSKLFAKCAQLQSVNINAVDTGTVEDMSYLFYGCEKLTMLDLSGLETGSVTTMKAMFSGCTELESISGCRDWDTGNLAQINYMFNGTSSLKTVDIHRWDLSHIVNSGWCFQNCAASTILLPDNLSVISAGFLNHAYRYRGSTFVIPSGVQKVGFAHTLYDFGTNKLTEYSVDKGNLHYKAVDGILYSADGNQMLGIPRGKAFSGGVYEIPEGVTFLGELSFSRNNNITKVVLPDSFVLRYVKLNDPDYIVVDDKGNLNAGLNLHIAIYCYTGIREYAVKPTNSRYTSVDGVIYTKDMQSLVAVPTRFTGKLQLPEGVTRWERDAMWYAGENVDRLMSECTGVVIPASLTDISPDQIDKLNRLEGRYSGFKIQVSPENPAYYVGKTGKLIKKPLIADMEIRLETDTVTYNGLEQTPGLTIIHNEKLLREGKDYTLEYENNVDAGTGWIRITALGHHSGSTICSFSIEPSEPSYTVPVGLAGTYGESLKNISLPDGFSWMHPEQVLSQTGAQQFLLMYHIEDKNYKDVESIPATIEVSPKVLDAASIRVPSYNPWYGRPVTPQVQVMDGKTVIAPEEYRVCFRNNNRFGIGTLQLEDVPGGNYQIEGSTTFWILPDPMILIAAITLLWVLTAGRKIKKTAGQLQTPSKNR